MLGTLLADANWLQALEETQPNLTQLLSRPAEEQQKNGYFHTLREICQQPYTWLKTAEQMISAGASLRELVADAEAIVLTGSGSSEFAGDCVRPTFRRELGITTQVIGGGTLLTYGEQALPPSRPALLVSLARSGDSPESVGAVSQLLKPDVRHLVLTCNQQGRLAEVFRDHSNVRVITLDDTTNDRSLVMTSSFTNLLLAAMFVGFIDAPKRYSTMCQALSDAGKHFLRTHMGSLATVAATGFRRAVFLGSGAQFGAARESSLKMLEMSAGAVATLCDSYLGFRHGPMSFAHSDTLIVCLLSCDPLLRAYESDLLTELDEKELGLMKLIVGENVPRELARKNDVILECPGLTELGDNHVAVIHVMAGQLLGFFRCLEEGLRPDSPSEDGVINRVVQSFKIHVSSDQPGVPGEAK
jgi:D-galactosamine 6-phosphate deaminase/isomerase